MSKLAPRNQQPRGSSWVPPVPYKDDIRTRGKVLNVMVFTDLVVFAETNDAGSPEETHSWQIAQRALEFNLMARLQETIKHLGT